MIIELSDFFNNPSLISLGPLKIQYYAITWLLSAIFIYLYLKSNEIIIELGISNENLARLAKYRIVIMDYLKVDRYRRKACRQLCLHT